jgi:hypothetical protein
VRGQHTQEVFRVNITTNTNTDHDEAQDILDALRKIQDSPELSAEAKTNPESVVSRMGLSGITRHAVAFALALAVVGAPAVHHLRPMAFWQ